MNVLVVEPGFLPYEKEIDGLHDMQKLVGGHIQAIYPFKETVALVCNESGALDGLEFNRSIPERGCGGIPSRLYYRFHQYTTFSINILSKNRSISKSVEICSFWV